MTKEQEYTLEWLRSHDLISHRALEIKCGISQGSLSKALRGIRNLPEHFVPALCFELKKYGFDPYGKTKKKFYKPDEFPDRDKDFPDQSVDILYFNKDGIWLAGHYNFKFKRWLYETDAPGRHWVWCYPPLNTDIF